MLNGSQSEIQQLNKFEDGVLDENVEMSVSIALTGELL